MIHREPSTTALQHAGHGPLELRSRTPWVDLRARARATLERLSSGLRQRLDLPARSEMTALLERTDRIDQALERLAARRAKSSVSAEP